MGAVAEGVLNRARPERMRRYRLTVGERILIRAGFACGDGSFAGVECPGEDIRSSTVDLHVDMPLFRHAEE